MVRILRLQLVGYRKGCQGIGVWYPAGAHKFSTACIPRLGPTQWPIQCIPKMLKGLESSSVQVCHFSWFVCWMLVRVMKRVCVYNPKTKRRASHYKSLQSLCQETTHKLIYVKRACWLCQVSGTDLLCVLALLTEIFDDFRAIAGLVTVHSISLMPHMLLYMAPCMLL
jgi:hypothetical protein